MAHQVFICHSAQDKEVAEAVCHQLEADGIACWTAPRDVVPGTVWAAAIHRAIRESRVLVLVHSDASNDSDQVLRELERAAACGVAILPLRISDTKPSDAVEYYIGSSHWLDACEAPLAPHLEKLSSAVAGLVDGGPDSPRPGLRRRVARTARTPLVAALVVLLVATGGASVFFAMRSGSGDQSHVERPEGTAEHAGDARPADETGSGADPGAGADRNPLHRVAIVGEYELHRDLMLEPCLGALIKMSQREAPDLPSDQRRRQLAEVARRQLGESWMRVQVGEDGRFISEGKIFGVEQNTEGTWHMSADLLISKTLYDDGVKLAAPVVVEWTFCGSILRSRPPDLEGIELVLSKTRPEK